MFLATAVLSVLLALGFIAAGLPKALARPSAKAEAHHLGHSVATFRVLGVLELAGAAGAVLGLWLRPLGVTAVTALLVLLAGAVRAHLRVKDALKAVVPAALFGAVALAVLLLRLAAS
ncbi:MULTISPECIES: DoxX family protein [unclassified Streptomyces]|uniref:DoxX family protein n=1 Tax=unclassified Streptomyces TaxID=2593676 RepID=UPI00371D5DB9